MKGKRVIYRLWHDKSSTGRVGYIGKDTNYPSRLYLSTRSRQPDCPKLYNALKKYPFEVWHKEVLVSGFTSDAALCRAEIACIKKYDSKNKGYNCTDGGEGSFGHRPSRKELIKMKRRMTGSKNPRWGKEPHNKGVPMTPEAKKHLSRLNKGKRHTKRTCKQISESLKGRVFSSEHRRRLAEAMAERLKRGYRPRSGWHHTASARRKIGEGHIGNKYFLGRKHTEEAKAKMRGLKRSDQAKANMRRAWKKRKAASGDTNTWRH